MKAPPLPKNSPSQPDKKDENANELSKNLSEGRNTEKTDQKKDAPKSSGPAGKHATEQPGKARESVSATPVGRGEPVLPLQLHTRLEAEAGKGSTRSPTAQQTVSKPQQAPMDHSEENRKRENREKTRQVNADKIGELLKLAYLRNMKPHEAAQFLHISDKAG